MKAYPKSEKEVVCFECKKPILSRDDLFITHQKGSHSKYDYIPVHMDCYGRVLKRNRKISKPFSSVDDTRISKILRKVAIPTFFIGIALFYTSTFLNEFRNSLGATLGSFMTTYALTTFVLSFLQGKKYKYIWNEFEQHLPSTCEQCTKTIPPGEQVCGACGWKYGQSASKSKRKLKH